MIERLDSVVIYENPKPHVHSRHGYFPGAVKLSDSELLVLFVRGEAFESPDGTTYVSRSLDGGNSWDLEQPLYDKSVVGIPTNDSLKATLLGSGQLVAVGYRFHRFDPEQGIGIEETNGILPGDNLVSFSQDKGRSWTVPALIGRRTPELLELSGPCIELTSGDLVAVAGLYKMPDGTNPSGQHGVLLRSRDKGRTWDDSVHFFQMPGNTVTAWEPRVCEMQPGRLVAIVWAFDVATETHLPNHVVVSHDGGYRWSKPINTGQYGQASSLLWAGADTLVTIQAHRGKDVGLYVRIIDFSNDEWTTIEEEAIWGKEMAPQTRPGQDMVAMFHSVRFGQPSLLRLGEEEFLAVHWSIEEGQGRIRGHRLRIRV